MNIHHKYRILKTVHVISIVPMVALIALTRFVFVVKLRRPRMKIIYKGA